MLGFKLGRNSSNHPTISETRKRSQNSFLSCTGWLAERIFFILAFLFFNEALMALMWDAHKVTFFNSTPLATILTLDKLKLTINLAILLGNIPLVFIWRKKIFELVIKERTLLILLVIALISAFWSDVPNLTLNRFIVLGNATLLGMYFAARYSWQQQLQLLGWAFGIIGVLSLLFVIFVPHYGVMGLDRFISIKTEEIKHTGAWRGIYLHKNILGRTMALGGLVFFLLAKSSANTTRLKVISSSRFPLTLTKGEIIALLGFGLSLVLVVGSKSGSALLLLLIPLTFWLAYRTWCWIYTKGLPFLLGTAFVSGGAAMFLVVNLKKILNFGGKDFTLSHRTELWATLFDKIWDRPWLGYGYGGFWQASVASEEVRAIIGPAAVHGHNGWLDLWLELGILGLFIFSFSFISAWFLAVTWARNTRSAAGSLPLTYLAFLFLSNLTESSLLAQKALWLLYVAFCLSLYKNYPLRER